MAAYYNEIDLYAAEWLRNLIKAGHIADGEVDTRSIIDVQPEEIKDFDQCHFFAGIAGWSHALRLSGWKDDRKIWTGSCPCQPFSVAGQGKGVNDERHLWPHFFRLIRSCRPQVVMGEQVAGAAGYGWLDGVRSDLEGESYSCEGVDIPACSANAPHIRQRLYWVAVDNANSSMRQTWCGNGLGTEEGWSSKRSASHSSDECNLDDAQGERLEGRINNTAKPSVEARDGNAGATGCNSHDMADAKRQSERWRGILRPEEGVEQMGSGPSAQSIRSCADNINMADANNARREGRFLLSECARERFAWSDGVEWRRGADGKTRRVKSGVCLLANGVPARVGKLRAYGNAIVPPLAAEVIKAFMEETK